MKKVCCSFLLVAGLVWSAPAQAATITFGGGGTTGFNTNGQFVSLGPVDLGSGLFLTVSPWSEGGNSSTWRIDSETTGYGVYNGVCVSIICDGENVDGSSYLDGLHFNFSQNVTLTQVVFTNWGSSDEVKYRTGGLPTGTGGFTTYSDGSTLNLNLIGSGFFFGAIDHGDEWRIRSLSYSSTQTQPIPTPEPVSLVLLGTGLLGLGSKRMLGRKSQRS